MRRRFSSTWSSFLLPGVIAAAGCGAPPAEHADAAGDARQADAIGAFEQPEALVASASRRLADLIRAEDIGQDFGPPSARLPYPDTYWPFLQEGTDARWNPGGRDPRTAIEKYMAITDPSEIGDARAWEHRHHGTGVPGVATWHGHCSGWAAAPLLNAPILHPVFAGPDGRGGVTACREGDPGCVRFEIGDVNALMAEIYLDAEVSLIGAICSTPAPEILRDGYGRVLVEGCAGVNPGSLLIAAATLLRRYRIPFALGVQSPSSTAEIWNQPTYRYHVYGYRPITKAEAANLVAHGTTVGPETSYPWNSAARGFAFVDLGLRFVCAEGPHLLALEGTPPSREMRVAAVIELDEDASRPDASIVGGEYLDLPVSNADRLTVPPFLWVARGPGPDDLPRDVGGNHHNPYIRPTLVKQLIALGQR